MRFMSVYRVAGCAAHSYRLALRPVTSTPTSSVMVTNKTIVASPCTTRFFSSSLRSSASPPPPSASSSARGAALMTAIKQLEHNFGKGTVMQMGARSAGPSLDVIPSGSLALDAALGVGGFPRGRVVEIYGAESSGKTTVALHVVAQAQKQGLTCLFIDAEHAMDPAYATALGVDVGSLLLSQPGTGEEGLEVADTLVRSGGVDVVVVDSVAALVPKAELEGEMGDQHMALQARLMSQALRKLTANLAKAKTLIIFLNQVRSKVGVIFGSPDVTTGGNALKFYSSIRCEVRRTAILKDNKEDAEAATGNMIKIKISKNKVAPPFRVAEFEMTYGRGISRSAEVIDLGLAHGIFARGGSHYSIVSEAVAKEVNEALAKESEGGTSDTGTAVAPSVGSLIASSLATSSSATVAAKGKKTKKGKKAKEGAAEEAESEPVVAAAEVAPVAVSEVAAAASATPAAAASTTPTPRLPLVVIEAGSPFANGREKAKQFLEMHPLVMAVLHREVRKAMGLQPTPGAGARGVAAAAAPSASADAVSVTA